jgi:hypothetical protein
LSVLDSSAGYFINQGCGCSMLVRLSEPLSSLCHVGMVASSIAQGSCEMKCVKADTPQMGAMTTAVQRSVERM